MFCLCLKHACVLSCHRCGWGHLCLWGPVILGCSVLLVTSNACISVSEGFSGTPEGRAGQKCLGIDTPKKSQETVRMRAGERPPPVYRHVCFIVLVNWSFVIEYWYSIYCSWFCLTFIFLILTCILWLLFSCYFSSLFLVFYIKMSKHKSRESRVTYYNDAASRISRKPAFVF